MPTKENRWLEYADRLDKLVDQHASQLVAAYDQRRSYNKRAASHTAAENSRKKIATILDTMRAIGESIEPRVDARMTTVVKHKDGDRNNNDPANLEFVQMTRRPA